MKNRTEWSFDVLHRVEAGEKVSRADISNAAAHLDWKRYSAEANSLHRALVSRDCSCSRGGKRNRLRFETRGGAPMSITWGNPDVHTEAFRRALAEYREQHPEDKRPFEDLEREPRTFIFRRQVEIYREQLR